MRPSRPGRLPPGNLRTSTPAPGVVRAPAPDGEGAREAGRGTVSRGGWSAAGYEAVGQLVHRRTGLVFSPGLRPRVEARIRHAMAERSVPDLPSYLALLASNGPAFDALVEELTVGETYFFREPGQFAFLRSEVLPALASRAGEGGGLRVWSAGCASGEEAYSLAILLHELGLEGAATVVGTDLSQERLVRARRGTYGRWSLRGVPEEVVRAYFRPRARGFELIPEIRNAVTFRQLNLAEDRYPSPASGIREMDLVLCRNVLIYLDPPVIAEVAHRLMGSLAEHGWLFLGASDPPLADLVPCEVVVTGAGIAYRRMTRPAPPRLPAAAPAPEREVSSPPRDPGTPLRAPAGAAGAPVSSAVRDPARASEPAAGAPEPDGDDPAPWVSRVRALANEGKLAEAGQVCSAALERHRDSAELMCLHAILLAAAGHHPEAAAAARRALYLDRRLVIAHLTLGNALLRVGDRSGALRALRNAERLLGARPPTEIVPASDGEPAGRLLAGVRVQLELMERFR